MKKCIDCKASLDEDDIDDDMDYCTDCRMDREIAAVVEMMKDEWPEAADWNCLDDDTVEILNAKDERLALISSRKLDGYYNNLEI